VFGVSSDECLNYAMRNRQEWEDCGLEATSQMIQDLEKHLMPEPPTIENFEDELLEAENQIDC
jgi:hypothetical protein